ncbi:MAG: AAA family ATPase [Nitrospirae bacterium]|nr:AAA family ATPase [Nitrospirota bacterium]MBI5696702.1 AAA family ATPase [Nitrospirota bacterium]
MDYLAYYGLNEQPFTNSIDNRFYYNSSQHGEALLRLKYAVSTMKGLAILVGDIGTGKTTLARRMLDELGEDEYESALLVVLHSAITAEWLLKKIAMQLGVEEIPEDKVNILAKVYHRLIEIHDSGKKAVVLIDEAQMLNSREIMEEFRGLLNLEVPGGKLVSFVFFGMPELEEVLSLDEPLKQRVAVKYRLKSFTPEMTEEYIRHRLKIAGSASELFTPDAVHAVHYFSKGIPRLINTLCDNALLEGYLTKRNVVGKDIVDEVAVDFGLNVASR